MAGPYGYKPFLPWAMEKTVEATEKISGVLRRSEKMMKLVKMGQARFDDSKGVTHTAQINMHEHHPGYFILSLERVSPPLPERVGQFFGGDRKQAEEYYENMVSGRWAGGGKPVDVGTRISTSYEVLGHPQTPVEQKQVKEGVHYQVLAYSDWADQFIPTVVKWVHGTTDSFTNLEKSTRDRSIAYIYVNRMNAGKLGHVGVRPVSASDMAELNNMSTTDLQQTAKLTRQLTIPVVGQSQGNPQQYQQYFGKSARWLQTPKSLTLQEKEGAIIRHKTAGTVGTIAGISGGGFAVFVPAEGKIYKMLWLQTDQWEVIGRER
jgi:hypothetical protein